MKKKLSRFDKMRQEKQVQPFLYPTKKTTLKKRKSKLPADGPRDFSAMAAAIRMLLSNDSKRR